MNQFPPGGRMVIGNWKMNLSGQAATDLAMAVARGAAGMPGVQVLLAPPFTVMERISRSLHSTPVEIAAQDIHWKSHGPYTGAISAKMAQEAGATYVLVGHSERRQLFGEDNAVIRLKLEAAWSAGLTPVLCVGENRTQRETGQAAATVVSQLTGVLETHPERPDLLIAYEPVWAIGTGQVSSPAQAGEIHRVIKTALPAGTRCLYGGSVVPGNAGDLLAEEAIDGLLVGTASLQSDPFLAIMRAAATEVPD